MNPKEIIKRNMPVLFIGALTVLVFVVIIFAASGRNGPATKLIEVGEEELLAPHTYVKGEAGAKVTLVEFTDFACPACKNLHPTVKEVVNKYSGYIRYGLRHFPLPSHKNADKAALAAQVAGEQGKFWEYGDLLFEYQGNFSDEDLVQNADILGLDIEKFRNDYKNNAMKALVDQDINFAKQIGINATPTFFVNGKQVLINEPGDLEIAIKQALRESGIDPESILSKKEQEIKDLEQEVVENIEAVIDEGLGTLEIEYTAEGGFKPEKTDAKAGQLIKWTNKSEADITLQQLMPRFEELNNPVIIKAGESFEFRLRLREGGLWTYRAKESEQVGRIYIQRLPDSVKELLPEEE